jgi:hypothetical protein
MRRNKDSIPPNTDPNRPNAEQLNIDNDMEDDGQIV